MIYLVELTEDKKRQIWSFSSEEKFCNHTITAHFNVVFATKFIPCFAEKRYIFKDDNTLKIYLDVFLNSLDSQKSLQTLCNLFEKIHSDKFFVLDLSDNQK